MSVLCVTLHFFTKHLVSREPQGCFTELLLSSHTVHRNTSPRPSVVKSIGFFLVCSISPRQQDCHGLQALLQHLGIPPSLFSLLRNTTNRWVMDQNSGQAIGQAIRASCSWPLSMSGSSHGQLLRREEGPQPGGQRPRQQAPHPSHPSAPGAKPTA